MKPFDVAIHGAGFVGQALALALAHNGFAVALTGGAHHASAVHVTDTGLSDIRAFALGNAAKAFLESLNAWPDAEFATPVHAMQVFGDAGGRLAFGVPKSETASADSLPLNWIVDVPALTHNLNKQVAGNRHITRLGGLDGVEVTVHAVCEGRHSELRNQLDLNAEIIRYPQHAIAARLMCALPHRNIARQWFNDKGEVLALLPLAGNEVALVWSLDTEHATTMMSAGDEAFTESLQIVCSKAMGEMTLCSQRALWPLMLSKVAPWTGSWPVQTDQKSATHAMWVLAGDAAHAVHPLAGQGLNLGLGDAALLAQTLHALKTTSPLFKPSSTQLGRALRRYARERQAAASHIARATDGLHLLFAHNHPAAAPLRNHGMTLLNRIDSIKNRITQLAQ